MHKTVIIVLSVFITAGAVFIIAVNLNNLDNSQIIRPLPQVPEDGVEPGEKIANFEECIVAGYPAMESYPRQCRVPGGTTFVEMVQVEDTVPDVSDLIHLTIPEEQALISSPLSIAGEARGQWYFEASFPIVLLDATGREIAQHYATAEGEWMTTEFVPFTAELEFEKPNTAQGTLVLHRDNPSDLPENDAELQIPIRFDMGGVSKPSGTCRRTGCSGEICADEEVVSTCEYREHYACYKNARCEWQADGACDWTITDALRACLANNIQLE